MGRYGPDDNKGHTFSAVTGKAAAPLTEVEKDLFKYIQQLESAVERLEKKVESGAEG